MQSHYYILRGKTVEPVEMMTWAQWFETNDRHVALDTDERRGITVSTVFLGIDHSCALSDEPIVFETMIFGGGDLDGYQKRYATYDEALAGHDEALQMLEFAFVLEAEIIE